MHSFSTKRHFTFWTAAIGIILLSTGCDLKDDYSNCPDKGGLEIGVSFTMNSDFADRFADEITRLDFFFFDENGLFTERVTDSAGPFRNGYTRLFDLPQGTYRAVIWGNLYDDTQIVGALEKGITTIDDLRLKLVTTDDRIPTPDEMPRLENFVQPTPTTLFWGKTEPAEVGRGAVVRRHADLLKDTHDIHITLRWKDYDGVYCFETLHQKLTRAYIAGTNGDMTFDNELPRERDIAYVPLYRNPAIPDTGAGQTEHSYIPPQVVWENIAAVMPDVRTMRLTRDGSTEKLVVTTLRDDGTEEIMYTRSIVDLIHLTGQYNTQDALDRCNDYYIVVDFRCIDTGHLHGPLWIAVTITVNGWVVQNIQVEI